jgi:hypothetical protein
MLSIANGWIRERVGHGEPLAAAIERFGRRLSKGGLTAFDPRDETQRNRAIRICVEASIEDLGADERARFGRLAILPEDEAIPLGGIEALWHESGSFDTDETDDLVRRLGGLSLLQELDLGTRALRTACDGNWPSLSPDNDYGWRFLIRHLRGAGSDSEADELLTNYSWIWAKLRIRRARDLFESYLP